MRMTHRFGQPSASRVAVLMALAAVLMLILSPSKPATAQVINPWVYGFASTETESVIEYGPPTFVTVKRTCTSSCAYGSSSVSYTIRFYGAASEELGSTMGSVPFSGTSNEVTVDWPSGGSGIRASREVYPAGTKSMTITLRSSFTGGTIDPARSTKTLTIVENPPVISFDQAEYTVEEGSKVTITVRRERPGDTSRVSWELSDVPSSDYQVLEGASPLEFTGSQTTRQIVLSMKKVPSAWKPRVGTLTLSAPVYGKLGTSSIATLTVVGASSDLPVITRLNPNEGWTSGVGVYVRGSGLSSKCRFYFGEKQALSVRELTTGILLVQAPGHPEGVVDVTAVCPSGPSRNTAADDFRFTNRPRVTSISPNSGTRYYRHNVRIDGDRIANPIDVKFGDASAGSFFYSSGTIGGSHISVVPPMWLEPGTYPVTVITADGTSLEPHHYFTFTSIPPRIDMLRQRSTRVNTSPTIEIWGVGFTGATSVTFGGVPGTIVGVPREASLQVVVPPRDTPGTVPVVVTTPDGVSPSGDAKTTFTYDPEPEEGPPFMSPPPGSPTRITLYPGWTLVTYGGATRDTLEALRGPEIDGQYQDDISGRVTAVAYWDASGSGCSQGEEQCWLTWFPAGVGIPGANDFEQLVEGRAYWVAINGTDSTQWTHWD